MQNKILKKFGQRVKTLRLKKGLSQEEFAHEIGVHRTYMGFIERGERNLTLLNIYKIANFLGIKLSKLFDFE